MDLRGFADRSPGVAGIGLLLIKVFAAAGLCWLLAGWSWEFWSPQTAREPSVLETDPARAASRVAAAHPFGLAAAVAPATATAAAGPLRLLGVVAGGAGVALLAAAGKPAQPFVVGDQVAPGVYLERVLPEAVELRGAGVPSRLKLEDPPRDRRSALAAGAAAPPRAAAGSGNP